MTVFDSYAELIAEVEGRGAALEGSLRIHHERLQAAETSGSTEAANDARFGINHTNGSLEVVREVKNVARECRDIRKLPFERMIGALESSYLVLEAAHDTQRQNQAAAFQRALAGGSRGAFEQATDDLNLATGRSMEIRGLLHFARQVHGR